jgi:hypothetical protein
MPKSHASGHVVRPCRVVRYIPWTVACRPNSTACTVRARTMVARWQNISGIAGLRSDTNRRLPGTILERGPSSPTSRPRSNLGTRNVHLGPETALSGGSWARWHHPEQRKCGFLLAMEPPPVAAAVSGPAATRRNTTNLPFLPSIRQMEADRQVQRHLWRYGMLLAPPVATDAARSIPSPRKGWIPTLTASPLKFRQ